MKKRALSLLMSLVMLVSMLPTSAWAASEDQKSVTVQASFYDGRSQEFVMVPQELEVDSGEATKLGYETDGLTQNADEVTVFDALVKAHEVIMGGTDGVTDALGLSSSGWVSPVMGETDLFGFAVNGGAPNDGVYNEGFSGYTGYSADQAVLKDGDEVQFFFYEDGDHCSDFYTTFDKDTALIKPEDTLELVASGYMYAYYNCSKPEVIAEWTQKISGAQLCILNMETGKLSPIAEKVTDSNGKVSVSFQEEGTYYLTLQSDEDYLIAPICKVTVSNDAPDQVRSCQLKALSITNFYGMYDSSKNFVLTPTFDPDITEYTVAKLNYSSSALDKMCVVTAEAEDGAATVKTALNGTESSGTVVGSFLPGQDNILTITVTNGGQSKVYTVTIPMAADPAAPVLARDKTATATVKKGGSYTLDLTQVFAKGASDTSTADLTYQVSVDKADAVAADANYSYTADSVGRHTLVFTAKSGSLTSPTYTVTLNVLAETDLVMHNIAAKYAASGVVQDGNSYWLAADMMAYEKTFPDSANKLTQEQKQAMMELAVKTLETSSVPGDLAKSIIALTAMGYDATKITTDSGAALDGVAKLADIVSDEKNTGAYFIYSVPYVIIAFQQYSDAYQAQLDKWVAYTLEKEQKATWLNTSWGTDSMAPIMLALAPYASTNADVKTALDEAVTGMAAYQKEDGSVGNAASTGLAITAVSALGMDPAAFVNATSGKSLVDGLMVNALASEDGFSPASNSFSTEQGFRGLISMANVQATGKSYRLFDFSGQDLVPAVATFWAQNAAVSFKTIPDDTTVVVKSGEDEVAVNAAHNAYDLAAGEYSYTVSRSGYQTKTGSFTVTEAEALSHAQKTINVSLVSSGSNSGSSGSDTKSYNVTVRVMVPPADRSKSYTYKHDSRSYTNLLTTTSKVTVAAGSSVRDAFVTALDRDGIGYVEQSNGYFPTIGSWSEFDRGEKSGWMYLVNGSMPSVAAQDYELTGNATVVWFYTDDYTNDYGSESWSDNDSSSSGTTTKPTTPENPVPDKTMPFNDVKSNDWYYQSVQYAYDNGLFSGVSHDSFAPSDSMDRSMLVTVLHSLDGKPAAGKGGFTDVADGAWYADAVAWAAEHGIVSGVSDSAFAPNGAITREQLAVMLYRYAQYKGYDVSKTADLSGYADQGSISDWAAQAVQWACGSGLMTGRSATSLAPAGTLTRAEAATMLKAFCENVKK